MLKEIKIQNFAIIENLVVNFETGLNVLTGETGAGKSIIIDALNLLLGGRADTDSIRTGETTALIEGLFQITNKEILSLVQEIGVETEDGELHIKRQVSNSGKNRCFLNDSQITVSTLAKIGDRLVDLHGQHDHQTLLHPEIHVDLLDLFGKSKQSRDKYSKEFLEYQSLVKNLQSLNTSEQERLQKEEFLGFQISEIDAANLSEGEEEIIMTEKNKLQHSEKIREALQRSQTLLSDQSGSILENLRQILKELEPLIGIDPDLASPFERSQSAFYELEDVENALRSHNATRYIIKNMDGNTSKENLGMMYAKQTQIERYDQVREIDTGNPKTFNQHLVYYYKQKATFEAQELAKRALLSKKNWKSGKSFRKYELAKCKQWELWRLASSKMSPILECIDREHRDKRWYST